MRLIFKMGSVTPDFFYVFNLISSFSTCSQSFKKICVWELLGANILKVPIMSSFLLFIWFRISLDELLRKTFSSWTKCYFQISFEDVQISCHFDPPFTPVFPWFVMSYDVESGNTWLHISLIWPFLLGNFSLEVHTRSILYGLWSQICRGKTSKTSQVWSHTFLNLCHNSEHVDLVISRMGWPQEHSVFMFSRIHIKITFCPNQKIVLQKFIVQNIV